MAQAFSSFDTYLAPFVREDNLSYKEVKNCIQSFVFGVNTPSRWGTQAPFTNITLDWTVPPDLALMPAIVGGKELDYTYGDCQKEMDMVNKAFIEIMLEGDANGRGFQYPIPSYSITKNFDWSESENNKLLFEMTAKYGTPYFSNYVNSDMEPSDVRSMCPLTADTKVLVRSSKGISNQEIGQLYKNQSARDTHYEVWTPTGWREVKFNAQAPTDIYEITLSNGAIVKMGENHLQPTKTRGTISAKDLQVGDWLPFNKKAIEGDDLGTYDFGFAVGAYAGDGSHDDNAIVYSLDAGMKDEETQEKLVTFWSKVGYKTTITFSDRNVRTVRVNGNPYSLICEYLDGKDALTKTFTNKVYDMSEDFRRGVLEGFVATDGARDRKRLYTSSPCLREDLCMLLSGLGMKYMANYVDTRDNRLGKEPNYRVDYPGRTNYGDLYKEDNDFHYYRINDIKKLAPQNLYCGEVDNEDRLFMLSNGLITHNCRLRLDLRELRRKSGGYFGSGESTGSVGVVTINLPRIAYLAENKEDFYKRLDKLMDISARSLKIKRNTITKLLEEGLYPYTKRYLGTFNNHFSTIGLIGCNEVGLNARWLRKDLTHKETQEFIKEVLNHMRERLSDYQEMYGDLYNLEATPAESTTYRLAKHDKEKYPDIITAAGECKTPYYTNSSHLPVGYTADVFEALDIQDDLQVLYTSGTVFHAFLGEKLPDWKAAADIVRKIAENYKLPYYTLSPTYSVCANHGYIQGEEYACPDCGNETEVYSRITGYYRPVKNFNDGKAQEFKDRQTYDIPHSHLHKEERTLQPKEIHYDIPKVEDKEQYILYASKTCPKCKIAAQLLDKFNIPYEKRYVDEWMDEVKELNILTAPTLIRADKKLIISDLPSIKKYIDALKEN